MITIYFLKVVVEVAKAGWLSFRFSRKIPFCLIFLSIQYFLIFITDKNLKKERDLYLPWK